MVDQKLWETVREEWTKAIESCPQEYRGDAAWADDVKKLLNFFTPQDRTWRCFLIRQELLPQKLNLTEFSWLELLQKLAATEEKLDWETPDVDYKNIKTKFTQMILNGDFARLDYMGRSNRLGLGIHRSVLQSVQAGIIGVQFHDGDVVFVWTKPHETKLDERGRPHCANGPAVTFGSGMLYYWHGIKVPEEAIERPNDFKIETIINEPNIELRRALIEILGWERLLAGVPHKVLDEDLDGGDQPRRLLQLTLTDEQVQSFGRFSVSAGTGTAEDRRIMIVEVHDPSTGRGYHLRVPPNMRTCKEAVAWTYGVEADQYAPVAEA